jgi:hypothetical protein
MLPQNFKELVKGNPISQIKKAITYLQPGFRQQLMTEYKVDSVDALAIKLQ